MNKTLQIVATGLMAAFAFAVSDAAAVPAGCHAALTVADARTLAEATPNARAFVANFGATLRTVVQAQSGSSAVIDVTARDPKNGVQEVGAYTVNLRTGHVMDDAEEPAEDEQTAAVRTKLVMRHCGR